MTDPEPRHGEVWWVALDPVVGSEIAKTRPAVVMSIDAFSYLPVRIVIPLTTWQPRFARQRNRVLVQRTIANGLTADSAADALQIRAASLERFGARLGVLSTADLQLLTSAIRHVTDPEAQS